MHRQRTNWLIDGVLFAAFVAAFFLNLTGVSLHQWLGVAVAAVGLYHLLEHWPWVRSVAGRLARTPWRVRGLGALDLLVMLGFAGILVTGLVISTWFALPLDDAGAWWTAHVAMAIATLVVVVVKVGAHGRWVITVARRHILRPAAAGQPRPMRAAAPTAEAMDRRAFLKLMGLVGGAAVLAIATTAVSAGRQSTDTASAAPAEEYAAASSDNACTVRCGRSCSYPGHCRKYTDGNGNGRCDLGECV